MGVFQERLGQVLAENKIKPAVLAREIGVSKTTISKYLSEEDRQIKFETVLKIAQFLNIDPSWLGGLINERRPFKEPKLIEIYEKLSKVGKKEVDDFASYLFHKASREKTSGYETATYDFPLLGKTAAGAGIVYGDSFHETVSVPAIPAGADFALMVKGDSMEPTIKDGSIVFVKCQSMVENGEIAIVDMDGEVTCKKVYFNPDGSLELCSVNPNYQPMRPEQARIIGRVII